MIYNERTQRHEQVVASALQMLTAARTAPKARGVDIIEAILVEGDDLKLLAERMVEIGNERNRPSFIRDAGNVLQAECIVAIGTRYQSLGLNCGHCGFATCAERENSQLSTFNSQFQVPCSLNSIDVGIAVGSACATAADLRLDTRVMYSIGVAVEQLGWIGEGVHLTMGIAVSASSKNPFFDRPTK
ncbi:MAG: ferredoxin [Paludibacteraceae bacterium]|nr:ferredoxin [Paludibacteraceae bacterium]